MRRIWRCKIWEIGRLLQIYGLVLVIHQYANQVEYDTNIKWLSILAGVIIAWGVIMERYILKEMCADWK